MLRKIFQTYIKRPVEFIAGSELFPSKKTVAVFQHQQDLDRWLVFSDKTFGGNTSAALDILPEGEGAVFRGSYSKVHSGQTEIARTGFCGIATKVYKIDDFIDIDYHRSLVYRVKGDGHTYLANLRVDNFTGDGGDVWQAKLQPPKGEWQDVPVPLTSFVPTQRGKLQSTLHELAGGKVISLGISLAPVPSMPDEGHFELQISEIRAEGLAG